MKDIFEDPEFDKWLYGGVHDLDEDIGRLVYEIYRTKIIETVWSCSGHIGAHVLDGGRTTRPETHWVYVLGRLSYKMPQNGNGLKFTRLLKEEARKLSFTGLHNHDGVETLTLEMKDISEMPTQGFVAHGEVKIEDAKGRYEEFKQFWKIAESLVRG